MKQSEELPVVEGYEPQKKTVSILWANVLALALFIVLAVVGFVAMHFIFGSQINHFTGFTMLYFCFIFEK